MPLTTATTADSLIERIAVPILVVLIIFLITALLNKFWLPHLLAHIQPLRHKFAHLPIPSKYTGLSTAAESPLSITSSKWEIAPHYSTRHSVYVSQTRLLNNAILASMEAGCDWDLDDPEFGVLRTAESLEWSIRSWVNDFLDHSTEEEAQRMKWWRKWVSSSDFAMSWCPRVVYGGETGTIVNSTHKEEKAKTKRMVDLETGERREVERSVQKPSLRKVEKLLYHRERLCSGLRNLHVLILERTITAQHTKPPPSLHSSTNSQDTTPSYSTYPSTFTISSIPIPSPARTLRPQIINIPSPSIGKAVPHPAKPTNHSSTSPPKRPHYMPYPSTRHTINHQPIPSSKLPTHAGRYTQFPALVKPPHARSSSGPLSSGLGSGGLAVNLSRGRNFSAGEMVMERESQTEGLLPLIRIRPTTWGRLNVDTLDLGLGGLSFVGVEVGDGRKGGVS